MASSISKYMYLYIKENVTTFLLLANGLFMIWTTTEEELLKFVKKLNQKHKTIKFYFKYLKKNKKI